MHLAIGDSAPVPMRRELDDTHSLELAVAPGTRYSFVLPDGMRVPDPASRQQDRDVHDPSVLVDPASFEWCHPNPERPWTDAILYEAHVGTLGGFEGVRARLPYLRDLGITALELMPVNDFPGQRNWGYDGVLPYAPDAAYGTPDALKALVDDAHRLGLMMFLDVVYNHFGPDGAYPHVYAREFFNPEIATPWGAGIDFRRAQVFEYFTDNALFWLMEYRFDGLRFDALDRIAPQERLAEMAARIRAGVEPGRHVHLVMEHGNNAAGLLRQGFDAQWTDDIHHALHVLLTGETGDYYADYRNAAGLLARCLKEGFAYQGDYSDFLRRPRGEPSTDLPTHSFVLFAQNHDHIGNRALGERLTVLADRAALRATHAFVLLAPFVPLLFMGEEWESAKPFQFFVDHTDPDLSRAVREGRRREFAAMFGSHTDEIVPDPSDLATFDRSVPDFDAAVSIEGAVAVAETRRLIGLRRRHIMPRLAGTYGTFSAAIGAKAVLGVWRMGDGATLRLGLNLGPAPVALEPTALPLLYATSDATGRDAQGGSLAGYSIAVWLSEPVSLSADAHD
jgi:maltooligosyltrehalose trehalohydrolase